MGGEFNIESREGFGTKVNFSIKDHRNRNKAYMSSFLSPIQADFKEHGTLHRINIPHLIPKHIKVSQEKCQCPKLLIVDDNDSNLFVLRNFAMRMELPYSESRNGKEAFETVKRASMKHCCSGFDLILMDINMPICGGIESTTMIKELYEKTNFSPTIIGVTANTDDDITNEALGAGMYAIEYKPIKFDIFEKMVSKFIYKKNV